MNKTTFGKRKSQGKPKSFTFAKGESECHTLAKGKSKGKGKKQSLTLGTGKESQGQERQERLEPGKLGQAGPIAIQRQNLKSCWGRRWATGRPRFARKFDSRWEVQGMVQAPDSPLEKGKWGRTGRSPSSLQERKRPVDLPFLDGARFWLLLQCFQDCQGNQQTGGKRKMDIRKERLWWVWWWPGNNM